MSDELVKGNAGVILCKTWEDAPVFLDLVDRVRLKYAYANREICDPKGSGGGETGVTETAFLGE